MSMLLEFNILYFIYNITIVRLEEYAEVYIDLLFLHRFRVANSCIFVKSSGIVAVFAVESVFIIQTLRYFL